MYIWEKRYNTAMLYRYPKSKKYPYEIPTNIRVYRHIIGYGILVDLIAITYNIYNKKFLTEDDTI